MLNCSLLLPSLSFKEVLIIYIYIYIYWITAMMNDSETLVFLDFPTPWSKTDTRFINFRSCCFNEQKYLCSVVELQGNFIKVENIKRNLGLTTCIGGPGVSIPENALSWAGWFGLRGPPNLPISSKFNIVVRPPPWILSFSVTTISENQY
jgi:hypothetical protein